MDAQPSASPVSPAQRTKNLVLRGCIGFLYLFIAVEAVDLLYAFYTGITTLESTGNRLLLSKLEVQQVAPVFLGILIMLELVETIQVYLSNHEIRIQMILLVGLTAITRHLLAFDLAHGEALQNFSLAALIIALGGAFFLIERAGPAAPQA